MAETLYK